MPLPQFPTELDSGGPALPLEAMPAHDGAWSAVKEGAASSLLASGLTRIKGYLGDQTPVAKTDAEREMRLNGYDASVLPNGSTVTRGYLDALQEQQSAIKRNGAEADDAGLRHTTGLMPSGRGVAEFAGGSVADSPFFLLGGGAAGLGLDAAGLDGAKGITGFGIRALEGEAIAGGYDLARKQSGTVPGDKDLGMYDFARDMALGGALGGVLGPKGHVQTEEEAQGFIKSTIPDAIITSGFRTVEHNAEIGGAKGSLHTKGQAVDVVLPKGVTAEQFRAEIEKQGLPITEFLVEKKGDPHSTGDHIHWAWGPKHGVDPIAHQQAVSSAAADAMQDRVPVSEDSAGATKPIWQTDEAQAGLKTMAEQPKTLTPEAEQLTQSANDAVKDAEHATLMNNPESDLSALQTHLREAKESVQGDAEIEDAIKAAVQCAMVKGFD